MHVDVGLAWGASVSLGAAAEFVYTDTSTVNPTEMIRVVLKSGDVLLANFGKLRHSLVDVFDVDTAPEWWRDEKTVRFGRARCNIQLRDTSMYRGPLLTKEQHRKFLYSTSV